MTGISELELDALWEEFRRVVNMTSQELDAWLLAVETDAEGAGARPVDAEAGKRVLALLHKRRADLTDADVRAMYEVVDAVEELSGEEHRGRLMALGHDPRKA
ncbi:DUF3140 domain-containing protein [Streptomyces sp. NPDC001941]|uniref:DUF3140 domain-containing protein n=1 Tax=Streptomyces sp. NPDC001941 TaxID=3154659 RepID=UPI00331EA267